MHLKPHMGKNSGTIHQYDFLCIEKMFKRSHSIVIPPHILTVFNLNLLLEQRFVVTYFIPILYSLRFGRLVPFQNLFPCCLAATLITIINNSHVFGFFFRTPQPLFVNKAFVALYVGIILPVGPIPISLFVFELEAED